MSEFDKKAGDWDKNQMHHQRSEAIANTLKETVYLHKELKGLEFGAGTGLLSFLLKDTLKEIILMDTSTEMLKIADEKILAEKIKNLKTSLFDLVKNEYKGEFDIIFTQMALHHIEEIEPLFEKFRKLLIKGGMLVIADLITEDGTFHGNDFTGHKGFDIAKLKETLSELKFKNMLVNEECYKMKHVDANGVEKEYPIFLLIAFK